MLFGDSLQVRQREDAAVQASTAHAESEIMATQLLVAAALEALRTEGAIQANYRDGDGVLKAGHLVRLVHLEVPTR